MDNCRGIRALLLDCDGGGQGLWMGGRGSGDGVEKRRKSAQIKAVSEMP